ncbi:MAG: hypothetical protein JNM38_06265 [Acidobacteria bacterium]|nr:hypothetical protein [Acidobacteriota bacterium]
MSTRALAWIRVAWIAATLALAALWRGEALALLVPLALLGPLVREVAPPPDQDERQRLEDYRASHIALMSVYALLFLMVAKAQVVEGSGLTAELLVLLAVPLIVRSSISLGRGLGARRAGLTIGFVFGGLWLGFAVLSHGVSVATASEFPIGGGLLALTVVASRWPRLGGALLTMFGGGLLLFFVRPLVGHGAWGQALALTATLVTPSVVTGLLLLAAASGAGAASDDEFKDLRAEAGTK